MKRFFLLALASFAAVALHAAALPQPNFPAAMAEVVTNLSAFIRVDTVNPPGNETRGAQFLKARHRYDRKGALPAKVFGDTREIDERGSGAEQEYRGWFMVVRQGDRRIAGEVRCRRRGNSISKEKARHAR